MMTKKFILLIILLNTLNSCDNVINEFTFMNDLNNAILEKYETEKVEISMNNTSELVVSINDAKFSNYSTKKKQKISLQIKKMAEDLQKDNEKMHILVKFVFKERHGIIKRSETEIYNMNNQ